MTKWLGDILFAATLRAAGLLFRWLVTIDRAVAWRMQIRQWWWQYYAEAIATASPNQIRLANCIAGFFNFIRDPEAAGHDQNPQGRQV